jgi:type IV pilus assembly protein PilA
MRNIALNGVSQSRHRVVARHVLICPIVGRVKSSGFTLVEMMVVVTIISILATLAMVGFRKITQSSHVSEATNMVQNIRVAQESYHSETQQYANISTGFPTGVGASAAALYPWQSLYGHVMGWGAQCTTGCNLQWSVLPLHVDGPVIFGYATVAGGPAAPFALPVTYNGVSLNYTAPTVSDWYAIAAEADLDGNPLTVTDVFSFSWSNQVFVSNEGQ